MREQRRHRVLVFAERFDGAHVEHDHRFSRLGLRGECVQAWAVRNIEFRFCFTHLRQFVVDRQQLIQHLLSARIFGGFPPRARIGVTRF